MAKENVGVKVIVWDVKPCAAPGCSKDADLYREYCTTHYLRMRKTGSLEIDPDRRSKTVARRRGITWEGKTLSIPAWARELGVPSTTLRLRLKNWTLERAMTTPPYPQQKKGRLPLRGHNKDETKVIPK